MAEQQKGSEGDDVQFHGDGFGLLMVAVLPVEAAFFDVDAA